MLCLLGTEKNLSLTRTQLANKFDHSSLFWVCKILMQIRIRKFVFLSTDPNPAFRSLKN
jgi:hypothetical protein